MSLIKKREDCGTLSLSLARHVHLMRKVNMIWRFGEFELIPQYVYISRGDGLPF